MHTKRVSVDGYDVFPMDEGILINEFLQFMHCPILNSFIFSFTITKEILQRAIDLKELESAKRSSNVKFKIEQY